MPLITQTGYYRGIVAPFFFATIPAISYLSLVLYCALAWFGLRGLPTTSCLPRALIAV